MTIVTLRKIHRIFAVAFAPFLLLTAVTGGILLFRNAGVYGYQTTDALLEWHNWEGLHAIASLWQVEPWGAGSAEAAG